MNWRSSFRRWFIAPEEDKTLDGWLQEAVSLRFACWGRATLPYKLLNWGLKTRQHDYLLYSKHLTWMHLVGENRVLSGAHSLQQQLVIWGSVSFTGSLTWGSSLIYSTDWGVVFEMELLELVCKEQENFTVKYDRIIYFSFTYFLLETSNFQQADYEMKPHLLLSSAVPWYGGRTIHGGSFLHESPMNSSTRYTQLPCKTNFFLPVTRIYSSSIGQGFLQVTST